jgi:hypothetical protein
MGLWDKLFGKSEKETAKANFVQPEESAPVTSATNKNLKNSKFEDLLLVVKSSGHPEYPLLRKEYSPASQMPAADFSFWIIDRLKEHDLATLLLFVKTLYGDHEFTGDSGFNVLGLIEKSLSEVAKKHNIEIDKDRLLRELHKNKGSNKPQRTELEKSFDIFMNKKIAKYINIDEQAIYELETYFILKRGISDIHREFWIGKDKGAELIAKLLSVYDFSIHFTEFEGLIKRANKFLKEMKNDEFTDYWLTYDYYSLKTISAEYQLSGKTDLSSKLRHLSIAERLHFFDFTGTTAYWTGDSSFKTRSVGIIERTSLDAIEKQQIFEQVNDLESIPHVISKGELKEYAETNGFELKKSWTAEKIYNYLRQTDEGTDALSILLKSKKILKLREEYRQDFNRILEYQMQIKKIADLLVMI